jgi:hypothetical protein
MRAGRFWARLGTAVLAVPLLGTGCGPTATVDRLLASSIDAGETPPDADATGGATGQGGATGTGGSAPGTGGNSGSGGSDPGTGGSAPGTGGDSGTGGSTPGTGGSAPGTGGSTPAPDAGPDTIERLEPVLEVSHAPAPATSNLTTEGKLDWLHWGLGADADAVNRKRSVAPLITTRKLGSSSVGTYKNRPVAVSWTDGTPTSRATDSTDGLVVADEVNAGFEFKAVGINARPRTLKLHLGGWQVAGKLVASLGGRTITETTFRNSADPGNDRVYTIVFQPISDGETLSVKWTVTEVLAMYGNITAQAATLSE